jgi:hypothetical protein
MADSIATPLQLWAGVGMYSGNAITANTQLANNVAAYNALAPIANLIYTIGQASGNVSLNISAGTLASLKALVQVYQVTIVQHLAIVCPAMFHGLWAMLVMPLA